MAKSDVARATRPISKPPGRTRGSTPEPVPELSAASAEAGPVLSRDVATGPPAPSRRLPWRGVLWLVGYAVVIGAAHYFLIAPEFSYLGFQRDDLDAPTVAGLLASFVVCARRLPQSWERPSAMIYWTLFLLVVAPVHVVPAFQATRTPATWTMVISVAAAFWLLGLIYSYRAPVISRPALPRKIYWFCFGIVAIGLLGLVFATYGFELSFVSLSEVYDVRDEFKETTEDVPAVAQYAITWLGSVFAPIAVARGMLIKNYGWVVVGCCTELLLVSITGYKSLLFSSVMVFGIFMLIRKADLTRVGSRAAVAITGCVVTVFSIDVLTNGITLSTLFIRRLVLTAGVNTSYYFEYFSEFPKAGLGHSIFSPFVQYAYELPPANHIGMVYYGDPETAANANLWADAFSNFGLVGVAVFTLIVGVVMVILDGICAGLPRGLALISFAMPAVSLSNSAMLTVFLTHGLLLVVVLMALMPEEVRTVRPLAHGGNRSPGGARSPTPSLSSSEQQPDHQPDEHRARSEHPETRPARVEAAPNLPPADAGWRPVTAAPSGVREDAPSQGASTTAPAEPAQTGEGPQTSEAARAQVRSDETGPSGPVGGRRRREGPPVEGPVVGTPAPTDSGTAGADGHWTEGPAGRRRPGHRRRTGDAEETTEATERES